MADINKDDMTSVFGVRKVGFGDTYLRTVAAACIVDQAKVFEIGDSSGINNSSTL